LSTQFATINNRRVKLQKPAMEHVIFVLPPRKSRFDYRIVALRRGFEEKRFEEAPETETSQLPPERN
jgi:hypothetical protein